MTDVLLGIAILLLGFVLLVLVLLWRRASGGAGGLGAALGELETGLERRLSESRAEVAERLERVKGDVRQELTDRMRQGFDHVRECVERQLIAGRSEQSQGLGETVARLEQKFEGLSERQSRGLVDSRKELAETLGRVTKNLEDRFAALEARTSTGLEAIRGKVDERLGHISEQVQKKLDENIKEGFAQFEKVQQHLRAAEEQLRNVGQLGASIGDLNNLLKLPHLRGRFGEASLERILADFLPAHMYELQAPSCAGGTGRADAVIRFPDRTLPIDSKFPREQILPLFESADQEELKHARAELERVIKEKAREITQYIEPENGTTNVALMFLPSETLWYEVVQNRSLAAYLSEQRVLPVSPNTLLLAVATIQQTLRWYQLAATFDQARQELAKAQRSFGLFERKFEELGRSIEKSQEAYRVATGHLSRYQTRITELTGEPVPSTGADTVDEPHRFAPPHSAPVGADDPP